MFLSYYCCYDNDDLIIVQSLRALALETYGRTSEMLDKLIEKLSSIIFHTQFYSTTGRKGSKRNVYV